MEKFYGPIGFAETIETSPSVWEEQIVEHNYYGDWIRNSRRINNNNQVNSNITISNELSIVSDPYANSNFHSMRYVSFMGTKWKVTSVSVQYPRLILTIGDIYNE